MADTVPSDLQSYAVLVGRHLRDLPTGERRAIEADLARHLHELGLTDREQCQRELGTPESYAAQLRDSLGLPAAPSPPQIRRRSVVVAIGLTLALVAASATWALTRPFKPPADFRALDLLEGASWNESGTSGGTSVSISVDRGGTAAMAFTLDNTSGHGLEVHGVRADPIGIDSSGGALAPLDLGYFESRPDDDYLTTGEIWATTVELADPEDVEVLEPTGGAGWREFQPFTWEPGQRLTVRFGGPVISCRSGAIRFQPGPTTGGGRKILIDYTIDGTDRSEEIGSYFIDFEACIGDGP